MIQQKSISKLCFDPLHVGSMGSRAQRVIPDQTKKEEFYEVKWTFSCKMEELISRAARNPRSNEKGRILFHCVMPLALQFYHLHVWRSDQVLDHELDRSVPKANRQIACFGNLETLGKFLLSNSLQRGRVGLPAR